MAAMGAAGAVGWLFRIEAQFYGLPTMKANTACWLIAIGIAQYFARKPNPGNLARLLPPLLGTAVTILGLLTLAEYLFSVDLHIDQAIIPGHPAHATVPLPGRMAWASAIAFTFLGMAVALTVARSHALEILSRAFASIVTLVSSLGILGYLYGVDSLYKMVPYTSMAPSTAVALFLSSIVVFASRPESGFMLKVTSATIAGSMARRLILLLPVSFVLLGLLRLKGQYLEFYDYRMGVAITIAASIFITIIVVVWQTHALHAFEIRSKEWKLTAETDPLTGLNNRRAFISRTSRELIRAQRYHRPISLIVMDIDEFKAYNDSFGHQAGDKALMQLSRILSGSSRQLDIVARYGGEEFTILLPETNHDAAMVVAENLRERIEAATFPFRPVTASFGVASFPDDCHEAFFPELFDAADAALYKSKRAGRNRVTGANQLSDPTDPPTPPQSFPAACQSEYQGTK